MFWIGVCLRLVWWLCLLLVGLLCWRLRLVMVSGFTACGLESFVGGFLGLGGLVFVDARFRCDLIR